MPPQGRAVAERGKALTSQVATTYFGLRREAMAARVVDARRAGAAHPVDAAGKIRLRQLRRRAAELVPGAGVDDEEAAVRVTPLSLRFRHRLYLLCLSGVMLLVE